MRNYSLCISAALGLAGCSALPQPAFERIDGRSIAPGSALERQFEADRIICQGDVDKAKMQAPNRIALDPLSGGLALREKLNEEGSIGRGCMASKGYLVAPSKDTTKKVYGFAGEEGPNGTGNAVMRVDATPHN